MKISVIMAVYNGGESIINALESILNQTVKDLELIIVDDGSKDNSLQIIEEYARKDDRIKIIQNQINIGLTKSLNKAIDHSKGKYIARQDHDDISLPERLEMQLNFLDNNEEYAFCGCNGIIKQNKRELLKYFEFEDIRRNLIINNCFTHSSIFIRKKILQKFGTYDEKYLYSQDYELWCRLLFKYNLKAKNLKEKLILMDIPDEKLHQKKFLKFFLQRINFVKIKIKYLRFSRLKFKGFISIISNLKEITFFIIIKFLIKIFKISK